ncbi:MAG: exonuclease SbcCD subunit D C-terminal domain-containing protein [Micrococcales bacterium]|nr:exonuclease SbcCD subunit D C-terminal domain-containing protein [Micrococcales bacterium]
MRLIHTSDWHLGRSFHQVGLAPAHELFLDHLVETARSEQVDAVLVSGDVYDRALPSPEAVRLLGDTLERLVDTGATVIVSSGNHDSTIRLGFGSGLLERAGLHIRTDVRDIGRPVEVGGVAVYPLPYLEPEAAAGPLGSADRTHAGVLRSAMQRVQADRERRGGPAVVMAHAFVTGATTSSSERDISVGGVSAVPTDVFGDVDYVALGHIHGPQQVAEHARYSGSPVAMSFGEAAHTKGSWLVTVGEGPAQAEAVAAPVHRRLAVLRGELADLLGSREHDHAEDAWCQVVLTDPIRPLGAMEQLRRRFPHTLSLSFDPQGAATPITSYASRVAARSPLDVCCDFVAHVRGGAEATPTERGLLREAIERSRLERAGRDGEGGVGRDGLRSGDAAASADGRRHDRGVA